MPRFVTQRDYLLFQHVNKELLIDVVDIPIVIYKVIPDLTITNIYGESNGKARYKGIQLHALIKYAPANANSGEFGYDVNQDNVEFRLQRKALYDVNFYPDVGDVIGYNDNFYEIHNINEIQLIASNPTYNHSVVCFTHLTRKSMTGIEEGNL